MRDARRRRRRRLDPGRVQEPGQRLPGRPQRTRNLRLAVRRPTPAVRRILAPDWGALTYTVPAGWANSADWPNHFTLTPSQAYAKEGPDGPADSISEIDVFRLPVAIGQDAGCTSPALSAAAGDRGWPHRLPPRPQERRGDRPEGDHHRRIHRPVGRCHDGADLDQDVSRRARGAPLAIMLGNGGPVGADTYSQGVMGSERERVDRPRCRRPGRRDRHRRDRSVRDVREPGDADRPVVPVQVVPRPGGSLPAVAGPPSLMRGVGRLAPTGAAAGYPPG